MVQAYSGSVLLLTQTNATTASIFVTTVNQSNSVVAGQIETSVTTVSNAGPDTAVNLVMQRLFGGYPYFSSATMSVQGTITNYDSGGYTWVQWTIPTLPPGAVATLTARVIPYAVLYPYYYENYTATFESMIDNGNDYGYVLEDSFYVDAGPGLFSFGQPSYLSPANSAVAPVSVVREGGAVGPSRSAISHPTEPRWQALIIDLGPAC